MAGITGESCPVKSPAFATGNFMSDVAIVGLPELGRAFDDLSAKLQRTVLRKALAAGSEVFRREERATAPVRRTSYNIGKRYPGYLKGGEGEARW